MSIITPVKNGAETIERCMESVFRQGNRDIEYLIMDGASTDGTQGIVQKAMSKSPISMHIALYSEPDESAGEAWNKGLMKSSGQILGAINSDDWYEDRAIEKVVEFFEGNPQADFVFGACNLWKKGRLVGRIGEKDADLALIMRGKAEVATPSAFYRRKVLEAVGLFDTSYKIGSDWDWWLRVANQFRVYRLPDVLANHNPSSVWTDKEAARFMALVQLKHSGSLISVWTALWILRTLRLSWLIPILRWIYLRGGS